MIHVIKPAGAPELYEKGLAKMVTEDEDGKRHESGDYPNVLSPGSERGHRVFWDDAKRTYRINITKEELQFCVDEIKLTDPVTNKLILKAEVNNERDPFFIHDELKIDVPNSGLTIDDKTGWGLFWWRAANSEPRKFNINNTTDNPLVARNQEFKVTSAGHDEKERNQVLAEGMLATDRFHAIKDNFKRLLQVCRALDIAVSNNPPIQTLRDTIYMKITIEKDFKTKGNVRNIEAFLAATDLKDEELVIRAMIQQAIDLGIITKEGKNLFFEEDNIGTSNAKAFEYFMHKENEKQRATLVAMVAEKSAAII